MAKCQTTMPVVTAVVTHQERLWLNAHLRLVSRSNSGKLSDGLAKCRCEAPRDQTDVCVQPGPCRMTIEREPSNLSSVMEERNQDLVFVRRMKNSVEVYSQANTPTLRGG